MRERKESLITLIGCGVFFEVDHIETVENRKNTSAPDFRRNLAPHPPDTPPPPYWTLIYSGWNHNVTSGLRHCRISALTAQNSSGFDGPARSNDKVWLGVCGGLADKWNINAWVVRITFFIFVVPLGYVYYLGAQNMPSPTVR